LTNFEVHHAANINDGSVKIGAEKRKKEKKLDCEKGENYPGFYENVRRSFVPNPRLVKGIPVPVLLNLNPTSIRLFVYKKIFCSNSYIVQK
jgi:hypothetical protein